MLNSILYFEQFCIKNFEKLEEIKNPPDLAHARIYDCILERCAPVPFSGKNFREEGAGATKAAAKEIVRKDNKI